MARFHIAAALAAASVTLLLIFHLLASFGLPQLDFLNLHYDPRQWMTATNQVPISSEGSKSGNGGDLYLLGVGKADITGYGRIYFQLRNHGVLLMSYTRPVVEINMMGYADPNQVGSGLRQRLYSRAFIIGDVDKPGERFVYLVLDTQSGDTAVRHGILQGLAELGGEYELYGQGNVAVTGTHSHAGPGAWLNYLLPQITSKGFDKQSYQAIVDGALLSIQRAHESYSPGYLTFASVDIEDANINRSPYAYLADPKEERARYEHDVDKTLTLLKFQRAEDGKNMGVLTWFPVHGTSMLGNNTLISGDNKGVAAYLFEQSVKNEATAADGFVAGFSQSNVGDTSPNVLGAYCEDGSGEKCNFEDSTCADGRSQACHGRGPFFRENDEGTRSCFEIGKRQFQGAKSLYDSMHEYAIPIKGSTVKSLHTFQDLSNFTFTHPNGTAVSTCPAALGYSFAAGTTDGPGAFDFKQNNTGSPNANPVWAVVSGFLREPSEAQKRCHSPKPILLDVGEVERPYLWTPNIVDIQLLRVGQLIIIASPGESTTMSGRRWKEAVENQARTWGLTSADPIVVLGGPANTYAHYIATEEEYAIQRYEGASTLYGPHTLNAYINLTLTYLPFLSPHATAKLPSGPSPPIHTNSSLSFITPVLYDRPSPFKSFGDVLVDVKSSYYPGETVQARFVGANPRNNLRLENTYAAVEKRSAIDGSWERVRDDGDWSLVFRWERKSTVLATSEAGVEWTVEEGVEEGVYRLRYWGDAREFGTGKVIAFEGISGEFVVR